MVTQSSVFVPSLLLAAGAFVSFLIGRRLIPQLIFLAAVGFLATGRRYRWLYILYKTLPRDLTIDETTDASGRKVGDVIAGVLKNDEIISKQFFLLACKEMPAANHVTIASLFNQSLEILYPNGVKDDNVLLLLTVSTAYITKAAEGLCHYLQIRTISSQFTVLLAQPLEFTVSRTTDLQRQFTVLELGPLQLRSTALELRSLQLRSTALELRPSDADTVADAHSSRTPVHKTGLLALAYSLTG
ncbi:hypothetical protein ANN_18319 [Periplaneta americana]|uniref:Uncharacterized protein n=1 Tax=Periplaneta americana TaxID=6978 RepID=A0ABQ8SNF0_PERAM|nr:hypothetical protein ANN_18319 [Periplaneta americana]